MEMHVGTWAIITLVFLWPTYWFWVRRYLDCSWVKAFGVALLAIILAIAAGIYRVWELERAGRMRGPAVDDLDIALSIVTAGLLFLFAVPLAMSLYSKWLGKQLTDEERRPSMDGVRAWLRLDNLVFALGTALCAWRGYGTNFWTVFLLLICALLSYPILNMLCVSTGETAATTSEEASGREDLSHERERVLRLLEDGKITAEECSELLSAG